MFIELTIIKNQTQYQTYLDWVDKQFDKKIAPETPIGQKVEVALLLIKQYQDEHYAIPYPPKESFGQTPLMPLN